MQGPIGPSDAYVASADALPAIPDDTLTPVGSKLVPAGRYAVSAKLTVFNGSQLNEGGATCTLTALGPFVELDRSGVWLPPATAPSAPKSSILVLLGSLDTPTSRTLTVTCQGFGSAAAASYLRLQAVRIGALG